MPRASALIPSTLKATLLPPTPHFCPLTSETGEALAKGNTTPGLLATIREQLQDDLSLAPPWVWELHPHLPTPTYLPAPVQLLALDVLRSFQEPLLGCFMPPLYTLPHTPEDPRGLAAGTVELGPVCAGVSGAVLGRSFLVELRAPADFHLSRVPRGLGKG